MKLVIISVFIICFQVSAASYGQQKITLKVKDASLVNVLKEIRKQSGYDLVYTTPMVNEAKRVNLNLVNTNLTNALEECFLNQPFTYIVKDKTIIISPKDQEKALAVIKLKGHVADDKGEPLSGAIIKLKGTPIGTVADKDGNFIINAPSGEGTLVVSFQGFITQEIAINKRETFDIKLEPALIALNDVVILGYTTVLKKDLTGAVSSLNPQQITRVQSSNLVQSLVGVPGVRVNANASGTGDIRVRGNRSVKASNDPTIILDGMPYYGSLNTIDQNDIASIDILKDASSTALYGSKGSNGVIVITTKKGVKGKASISFDSFNGVNVHEDGNLHPMDAAQYIQFKRDANKAAGIWASPADDSKIFTAVEIAGFGKVDNKSWENFNNDLGFQSDNTLTIVNGGEKGTQKISLNFYNNNARGPNMSNYDRYILSTNIDHQALKRLKVGVTSRVSYEFQQYGPSGFVNNLFRYPPTVNFFDASGQIIQAPAGDPNMRNPYLDLNRDYMDSQSKKWDVFIKGYATYSFTNDLTFTSNVSIDESYVTNGSYQDNRSASYTNAINSASITDSLRSNFAWNNILSYKKKFGKHSIDATGVLEIQNSQLFNNAESGQDISLSQYKWYNLGAALQNQSISSLFSRNQLLSYVGRVQYGYEDKYLISVSARDDGASQLSPQDRWELFPAVAGAWRIGEEPFIKQIKAISDLKVRASYGLTGNNAIAPYGTQGSVTSRYTIFGGASGDVPYATNEPNEEPVADLKWEKTRTLNLGVDFGFFDNRITGTFDYYNSMTSDLLNLRLLPYTTGFNAVWANIGRSQNKGYEFSINAKAIDNQDFKWNVNLSFYHNKEKLLQLYDPRITQDIANNWFVGYPVTGVTYTYKSIGIWQTSEAKTAAIYGASPGDVKIKDLNGDGKIDGNDREIIGTERPDIQSSLITNMTWKQFDMSMDFYSEFGAIADDTWSGSTFGGSIGRYNIPVINYWTPTNPSNTTPQPKVGLSPLYLSSTGYHSNNYIRLRNVTLGYTFSKKQIPGVAKFRIFASSTGPLQYWSYLQEGGLSDKTVIYNLGVNVSF